MKPELYFFEACPYCKKITDFIDQHSIHQRVILKEIRKNHTYYNELLSLTQDDQVPCLVYRGEPLLNSEKILQWMNQHLVNRER
jgi:glutaredoxin 3